MSAAAEVFRAARDALERAGLRHALVGATTLGRFTLPRATLDMDFLVEARDAPLDEALRGLTLIERARDPFFDQAVCIFEVPTYVTPVEMFVATHWLTRQALARAERTELPPFGDVPVLRVEDTVLIKAVIASDAARPSGKRSLDLADLQSLAAAAPDIDARLLREAVAKLPPRVADTLREAGFPVE